MSAVSLIVTPTGLCECLYTEAIDLARLGDLSVRRATDIAFDNGSQEWRVRDTGGRELYGHASREACLTWEREYLERQETAKHGGET